MDLTTSLFGTAAMRITAVLPVAVVIVALAWPAASMSDGPMLALLILTSAAVLAVALGWAARGPGRRVVAAVAIASAIGLVGATVYLRSLDPDGAEIPLVGVGVLFLSMTGLVIAGLSAGIRTSAAER